MAKPLVKPDDVHEDAWSAMDDDQKRAAIANAKSGAGNSAAAISDTEMPTLEMLHARMQAAEALLEYLFLTHYRNVDRDTIVAAWLESRKPSPVLDPQAVGRT